MPENVFHLSQTEFYHKILERCLLGKEDNLVYFYLTLPPIISKDICLKWGLVSHLVSYYLEHFFLQFHLSDGYQLYLSGLEHTEGLFSCILKQECQ